MFSKFEGWVEEKKKETSREKSLVDRSLPTAEITLIINPEARSEGLSISPSLRENCIPRTSHVSLLIWKVEIRKIYIGFSVAELDPVLQGRRLYPAVEAK